MKKISDEYFNEHRLYGRLTKERALGIPLARNLLWTIVRRRFDKLPNNCQMLENNKVEADTRKNRNPTRNDPARLPLLLNA